MNTFLASWLLGFLAFPFDKTRIFPGESVIAIWEGFTNDTQILGRMTAIAATATLVVYAVNSYTFLLFYKEYVVLSFFVTIYGSTRVSLGLTKLLAASKTKI